MNRWNATHLLARDGMKQCQKCKRVRPVSEYRKSKQEADGLAYRCNACRDRERQVRARWKGDADMQVIVRARDI